MLRVAETRGHKKLEPTSPSLPTVLLDTPAEDSPTTTIVGGDWASAREARDLSVLAHLGRLQRWALFLRQRDPASSTQEG